MSGPRDLIRFRSLSLLLPFAVYLAGVALLGDWIIDDAGISYAYARNAALGHGLVSQPGRPPVEGFSNFLWVVLLAPLFVVRLFDPVWVPKALGALLVLGAFALVQRALRRATGGDAAGLLVTLLCAAAPPIVIWTASGLENGLTLLLAAALYAHAVERPRRWRVKCGALAGLLAMTHPDGVVLGGLGALLAAADLVRRRPPREIARDLGAHALGLAAVLGPFLLFRLAVFGLPWPHTYYAKRVHASPGAQLAAIASDPGALAAKLEDLCRGTFGPAGAPVAALTVLFALALAARGLLPRHAGVAVALAALAVAGYLWIDVDWMGEYRFATAAVLLSITSFVTVGSAFAREVSVHLVSRSRAAARARLVAAPLAGAVLVALAFATFSPRTVRFAANPPTPYRDVERSFARKLDAYASLLGISRGSALLPDVGATLFGSRLTVYDAAGLCEPDVIRTLKRGGPVWLADRREFHDLVFERLRPTFISTHHFWTFVTAFDDDPRFERDYIAIDAYEDAYVKRVFGRRLRSGDFVRRDALADARRLEALRATYRPAPRLDPFVVRVAEGFSTAPKGDAAIDGLRVAAHRALHEDDDPNRAATLLGRVLERDRTDVDAALARAAALDSAARPDEARREWQRVRELAEAGGGARASYAALARARLAGTLFPGRTAP